MNKSPFTPLHRTLKACKCGHISSRSELYKHFKQQDQTNFFTLHGEVPLNEDDPRILEHILNN